MYQVGAYLQQQISEGNIAENDRDQFARTAFNRFYYSAFHAVNELVIAIDPDQASMRHGNFPDYISNTLASDLNNRLKRRFKVRAISGQEYNILKNQIHHATKQLARLISNAYSTRVIADYKLSVSVSFRPGGFSLSGTDIKVAHKWQQEASLYCATIRKAWRSLNEQ